MKYPKMPRSRNFHGTFSQRLSEKKGDKKEVSRMKGAGTKGKEEERREGMRLVGTMQPCRRSVVKTPSIKNITPSWPCSDRLSCNSPSTTWNSE